MEIALQIGLGVLLWSMAISDLLWKRVPVVLLLITGVIPFVSSLGWGYPHSLAEAALGVLVVAGVISLLYIGTKKKGIGEADILMGVFLGGWLGWTKGLLVFSLGNMIGLAAIALLFPFVPAKKLKEVPLVFFLVIAFYVDGYFQLSQMVLDWMQFGAW